MKYADGITEVGIRPATVATIVLVILGYVQMSAKDIEALREITFPCL